MSSNHRHRDVARQLLASSPAWRHRSSAPDQCENVADFLADRLRLDAVFEVVCDLPFAARRVSPSARAIDSVTTSAYMITLPSTLRAARPIVWISDGAAAQIAFFIGIEDADQRDFGQIEPFAQQIDADQHVELALAQIAQDRDPFERLDLAVQVAHPQPVLEQVVGQVFGHLLGQRRDQHALVALRRAGGSLPSVVDLMARRTDLDFGIDEPRRTDDHLDDLRRCAAISYVAGVAET